MMHWNSILVTLVGIAAIIWILRYFLGDRGGFTGAEETGGRQRVRIRVKGGYEPARVILRRGVPAELEFYRDEEDSCSERLVIDGFGRNVFLPAHQSTLVQILPERNGSFPFTCGMGMLKGEIVVTES